MQVTLNNTWSFTQQVWNSLGISISKIFTKICPRNIFRIFGFFQISLPLVLGAN